VLLQLRASGAAERVAETAKPRASKLDAACADAGKGQACSVENRRGKKVHGVCMPKPGNAQALSCSLSKQASDGPAVPAEALVACEDKNITDRCVFATADDGNITGKCFRTPAGMLCRKQHGAPDAARAACATKQRDAECGWENKAGKQITGRCKQRGDVDACVPSPPRESVEACARKEADQSCSFQFKAVTVNGTCHSRESQMVCSPTQRAVWSPVGPAGTEEAETRPTTAGAQSALSAEGLANHTDHADQGTAVMKEAEREMNTQRTQELREAKEAACVNATVDDACSFTGRNGDVAGTCQLSGKKQRKPSLVCKKPRGMPENTTAAAGGSEDDDDNGEETVDEATDAAANASADTAETADGATSAAVNISVTAGVGEEGAPETIATQ
jgi:hypothetical protein